MNDFIYKDPEKLEEGIFYLKNFNDPPKQSHCCFICLSAMLPLGLGFMVHRSRDDISYLFGISICCKTEHWVDTLYILIDTVQAWQLRKSAALLIAYSPDNTVLGRVNRFGRPLRMETFQITDFGLKSSVCIHPPIELGPCVPCIVFCFLPQLAHGPLVSVCYTLAPG